MGEFFTPHAEEPERCAGLHSQPAGVSVWVPNSCGRGEKTAGSLSHLSRDKAATAGETAAFGRLSRGYRRNRGGAKQDLVQVLNRFIEGSESSGLWDTPSGPGLTVAWVYTDYYHWWVPWFGTEKGVTCTSAYRQLTVACFPVRIYSLENLPIFLFGKMVIHDTRYRWKSHW